MQTWISNNIVTILLSLGLIGIVASIISNMIKERKSGNKTCGSGCSGCPLGGKCSSNQSELFKGLE